ncbi:MAG: periplasmic heavy metal sensor [Deltaproteobacteria bacterium]|nr:periplasmic heavy metal sensor [Deltaproteobacteria bacterium]
MKEKLIIFLLIFSLTINVAALITMGYFWGRGEGGGEAAFRRSGESPRLGSRLSLDKVQQRKMRGMRGSLFEGIKPVRDELEAKREDLVNLLTTKEPDRILIDQKIGEINSLQSQIQHAVIDTLLREKEFLNPMQQKEYFDVISRRLCQNRFFMGRGRGQGMGRGDGSGSGRGQGQGIGRGDGSGRGQGQGIGRGDGSGRGQGQGIGRGDGSGRGRGQGQGMGMGDGSGQGQGKY